MFEIECYLMESVGDFSREDVAHLHGLLEEVLSSSDGSSLPEEIQICCSDLQRLSTSHLIAQADSEYKKMFIIAPDILVPISHAQFG